jgi:hypothetical protein
LWYKDYRIVIPALVSSVITLVGILISDIPDKDEKALQEKILKLEQKLELLEGEIRSIKKPQLSQ